MIRRAVAFWTARVNGASVALFRIVIGVLATWTALGAALNADRYFGEGGMIPWALMEHYTFARLSVLAVAPTSSAWLYVVVVALVLASFTFTIGLFPRVSAAVVFVCEMSLHQRNPYVMNSGDRLFSILMGLSIFLPLARRWSVHAWWRARRGRAPGPLPSIWSTRVIELQIAYVYLFSTFAKIEQERWQRGLALRDVLASPVYAEWPVTIDWLPLVYAMTWGTLLFELSFPLLVWQSKLRRYLLAAGVLFHGGIDLLMTIPMFSAVMVSSYALFLGDDDAERLVSFVLRRPRPTIRVAPT